MSPTNARWCQENHQALCQIQRDEFGPHTGRWDTARPFMLNPDRTRTARSKDCLCHQERFHSVDCCSVSACCAKPQQPPPAKASREATGLERPHRCVSGYGAFATNRSAVSCPMVSGTLPLRAFVPRERYLLTTMAQFERQGGQPFTIVTDYSGK